MLFPSPGISKITIEEEDEDSFSSNCIWYYGSTISIYIPRGNYRKTKC